MARLKEEAASEAVGVIERDREPGPSLLLGVGRGQTGKSCWARWVIDRARHAGRTVIAGDGDRSNATLTAYYQDASRPRSAEDPDVHSWITGLVEAMAVERTSAVLDIGGGDRTMEGYAAEFPLLDFCGEHGIRVLVAYFVAPNLDSLGPIETVDQTGIFRGADTIVVLNEGLVPFGTTAESAFAPVRDSDGLRRLADHARLVLMPKLGCMAELERRRAHFFDRRPEGLGPMNAFRVKHWCGQMEEAFQPVLRWLP